MTPFVTGLLSLLIAFAAMAGITTFVSYRVRQSSSVSPSPATQAGASFVVRSRGWQGAVLRWTGIFFVVVGCVLLLLAILFNGDPSMLGAGVPGVVIALVGFFFVWMARGVTRARLEVTPDAVWVYRWTGAPRQVSVREIARLQPLTSNNYGGVVARSEKRRLFSATRLMLGYPQLIEYFRTTRPDLPIPDSCLPL